jgi:hypothetical protein
MTDPLNDDADTPRPGFDFDNKVAEQYLDELSRLSQRPEGSINIECPTSSVAQANLTIKIDFNISRSFSSSDILTIYLHTVLQSPHPSIQEKLCSRSPAGFPPE